MEAYGEYRIQGFWLRLETFELGCDLNALVLPGVVGRTCLRFNLLVLSRE